MNTKYLAYLALLAGWLAFCYWLYAREIYPQLHGPPEKSWSTELTGLDAALAFRWGSAEPVTGNRFEAWRDSLEAFMRSDHIMVFSSYYFLDETPAPATGKKLALHRLDTVLQFFGADKRKLMFEILHRPVEADVRNRPLEMLDYRAIPVNELFRQSMDTLEVCFPLRDSFFLPLYLTDKLDNWMAERRSEGHMVSILGIADGSGISESNDVAWERALFVKNRSILKGWNEEQIQIATGQRSEANTLRNRCVMVYLMN